MEMFLGSEFGSICGKFFVGYEGWKLEFKHVEVSFVGRVAPAGAIAARDWRAAMLMERSERCAIRVKCEKCRGFRGIGWFRAVQLC
jgi:hypothetical protein